MTDTAAKRYSIGAILFHWTIAIAVIVNWRWAVNAKDAATREEAIAIFADHKALGILILALTLGRVIWRWTHPVPPLPGDIAQWEKVLARSLHVLFYVLLIALPIGGWLANSLTGRDIDMFGFFTIPPLPIGSNEDLGGAIFDAHALAGETFIVLIGLHILGALKHTMLDGKGGIMRMMPFGKVPG